MTTKVAWKTHYRKRMHKLADFLDTLNDVQFDFNFIAEKHDKSKVITCGTVGCAIGFTPHVFPRLVKYIEYESFSSPTGLRVESKKTGESEYEEVGAELFGISMEESDDLFTPYRICAWNDHSLGDKATASDVAGSIRRFVEWKLAGGDY